MVEAGVKGKSISLKLKRRKSDAPEPYKFLGHGPCDNVSRSVTLNRFTDSVADLTTESRTLLRALRVPATQIRGIGISVITVHLLACFPPIQVPLIPFNLTYLLAEILRGRWLEHEDSLPCFWRYRISLL